MNDEVGGVGLLARIRARHQVLRIAVDVCRDMPNASEEEITDEITSRALRVVQSGELMGFDPAALIAIIQALLPIILQIIELFRK